MYIYPVTGVNIKSRFRLHLISTEYPQIIALFFPVFIHLERVDGLVDRGRQDLLLDRHGQKVWDRQEDRHN